MLALNDIEILGSKEKLSRKRYPHSLLIQQSKIVPNDILVVFVIHKDHWIRNKFRLFVEEFGQRSERYLAFRLLSCFLLKTKELN